MPPLHRTIPLLIAALTLLACDDKDTSEPAAEAQEEVASAAPVDPAALLQRARESADPKAARGLLLQVLEAQPDNLEAKRRMGEIALEAGDIGMAYEYFSEAHKAKPDDAELHHLLIRSLIAADETDRAITEIGSLLSTDSEFTRDNPEPRLLRAQLLLSRKRVAGAVADFQAVLEMQPDNAEAREGLARAAYAGQRWAQAAEAGEATGSEDAAILALVGMSYVRLGDAAKARPWLERAREAGFVEDPEAARSLLLLEGADLLESLGYVLRELGEEEAAAATLGQYLERSRMATDAKRASVQETIDALK